MGTANQPFPPKSPNPFPQEDLKIVTVNSPGKAVLQTKTKEIQKDEMPLAQEIAKKLFFALDPFFPAAGLAAPQIGINRSVFIFSYDRTREHVEVVVNPTMKPTSNTVVTGWEGCFSILFGNSWQLAQVPRYESIEVTYTNWNGEKVVKRLDGFAAKVFQHEYDHLQGVEVIDREDAIVKQFASEEELQNFLRKVKEEDSKRYHKPNLA